MKFLYLFLLSLIPVCIWMGVYTFLNPRNRRDSILISIFGILFGALAMIPVLLLQFFWITFPELNIFRVLQSAIPSSTLFYSIFFLFVAVLEEVLKAGALVLLVRKFHKSFDQVVDGIVFGAFVALGFAFAENIYYFMNIVEGYTLSMDFLAIFNLRSFGTMLSHTIFTGTFGVFYAISYFGVFTKNSPFSIMKVLQLRYTRSLFLPSLFKPKNIYRYLVLSEGLFYAVALHWLFNLLVKVTILGVPAVYFTVPFLIFSSLWLWSSFFDDRCMKVLKVSA